MAFVSRLGRLRAAACALSLSTPGPLPPRTLSDTPLRAIWHVIPRILLQAAKRKGREAEIIQHLSTGSTTAFDLAVRIYTSTPPELLPAATRNVLAHLIDLTQRQRVRPLGVLSQDVAFELIAG